MKLLLLIILSPSIAFSQRIAKIKYSVDTISVFGKSAPVRRTPASETMKYYKGSEVKIISNLELIERLLGAGEKNVMMYKEGRQPLKVNYLDQVFDAADKINKLAPEFDTKEYIEEAQLYIFYNGRLERIAIDRRNMEDSIKEEGRKQLAREAEERRAQYAAEQRQRDSLAEIRYQENQKEWLADCIKEFGQTNGKLIANNQVRLGFTKEMCARAWGNPETINKTITNGIVVETWWYSLSQWLIFKNGKLVSITE